VALQNRVDPWGDLHAVPDRGLFTGNRGCLVDDQGHMKRHHNGSLWITCRTEFRGWSHPLAAPRVWTPLFFLDDAVALAAGHRPCGLCRRDDYLAYRDAVTTATNSDQPVMATALNRLLTRERLHRGRGLARAADRIVWSAEVDELPVGVVVVEAATGGPQLLTESHLQAFTFGGWGAPIQRPQRVRVEVLTPPTSVGALSCGFVPQLHSTAVC
jgi:hypothetical protein